MAWIMTPKRRAALKKAQQAARRKLGKVESKGGFASRMIKRAGLSQKTSGAGGRGSGRRKLANRTYNKTKKGIGAGPSGRGRGGYSLSAARSTMKAKGVNSRTLQRLIKRKKK